MLVRPPATTLKLRGQLQRMIYNGVRIPLGWHAKDLEVDVNYTLRRQRSIRKSRLCNMSNSMTKVRLSKRMCFKQRLALAGCSSTYRFGHALLQVSMSKFNSCCTATATALGCNGPGESTKTALVLTGGIGR